MIARRGLLAGVAALSAGPATAQLPPPVPRGGSAPAPAPATTSPLAVRPDDWVAPGHARQLLIRWGDRVNFDAPSWDPRNPTVEAAFGQFGWDGRIAGLAVPPLATDGIPRLVLAVAHPHVDPAMAWPGGRDRPDVAAAMQGASLLNLERTPAGWVVVDGGFQSRRLGPETVCRWTGPAAAALAVQGLLGPEGGAATPWGSLLLTEGDPGPWLGRLAPHDLRWNEARRWGWVVELDPFDPQSVPAKRTALGRIGAAAVAAGVAADGRAAVFLADGREMGFLYRFLSAGPATEPDALDAGTLHVAAAEGTTLRWIALPAMAAADPAAAALQAGGTRFDMPSALALDPRGGRLLLACRADTARGAAETDPLNPRAGAHPGHIIELRGDVAAPRMDARLLFLAGDATEGGRYGAGPPPAAVPRYPATLAMDGSGRLWVGTDRAGRPGAVDGVFLVPLDGPGRGMPALAYAAPRGAGIGGAVTTPEADAALVLVRTPGTEPGASFDRPTTRWPGFEARMPPRTTLVALARQGGGAVFS
jgi:secreted PhoX family phosphatase